MKRGINIGDHFEETYDTTVPFKTPMQEWYYDKIPKSGFDHVRLPVRWSIWTDDDNGYKINPMFFAEVEKTVKRLLDLGLEVVLNVHHFREASDDPKGNFKKLKAIWEQVAKRFCDYPQSLVFEVMNEPTWRTTAEDWNEVQDAIVGVIRETNKTRRIMLCGIDYSGIFALDRMIPPKDDNLIGTFHYYFPLEFTHQGAHWSPTYKDLSGVSWKGTDEQISNIENDIRNHAVAWGEKYGIPMNLGEFGVYGLNAEMEDRARWTRCVCDTCEKFGISWSYWELDRGFGCFKPDGEPVVPILNALTGR